MKNSDGMQNRGFRTEKPPKRPASAFGFFSAHFDGRSHFVYSALQAGLEHMSQNLNRQIDLVRVDESVTKGDLVTAIKSRLNEAVFAICDITPGGASDQPQWNPNVFYELGMAEQLELPTFLICDRQRQPTQREPLPFDIAHKPIKLYDFTPLGLKSLSERFIRWLEAGLDKDDGNVSVYEQSQLFVNTAREIKRGLHSWRGPSAASFRQLVARMIRPIQAEAANMSHFERSETNGSAYTFEPPKRSEAVEQLFIAMMDSLTEGDQYSTLSTLSFWLSFRDGGRSYREACAKAAQRGVIIRRILTIPEDWDNDEKRLIVDHVSTYCSVSRSCNTYELRLSKLPRIEALRPQGHAGVCYRQELGVATAFQPEYDPEARVSAIKLRNDADDVAREFEERWGKTPVLNPEAWL